MRWRLSSSRSQSCRSSGPWPFPRGGRWFSARRKPNSSFVRGSTRMRSHSISAASPTPFRRRSTCWFNRSSSARSTKDPITGQDFRVPVARRAPDDSGLWHPDGAGGVPWPATGHGPRRLGRWSQAAGIRFQRDGTRCQRIWYGRTGEHRTRPPESSGQHARGVAFGSARPDGSRGQSRRSRRGRQSKQRQVDPHLQEPPAIQPVDRHRRGRVTPHRAAAGATGPTTARTSRPAHHARQHHSRPSGWGGPEVLGHQASNRRPANGSNSGLRTLRWARWPAGSRVRAGGRLSTRHT